MLKYKSYEELVESLKAKKFDKRLNYLAKKYKNKKIVIYGAGIAFDAVSDNYDLQKLNISAVADIKFQDNSEYKGFKTIRPESIMNEDPYIVLICMIEPEIAIEYFEDELFSEYGKFKYDILIKLSFWDFLKSLFE